MLVHVQNITNHFHLKYSCQLMGRKENSTCSKCYFSLIWGELSRKNQSILSEIHIKWWKVLRNNSSITCSKITFYSALEKRKNGIGLVHVQNITKCFIWNSCQMMGRKEFNNSTRSKYTFYSDLGGESRKKGNV